MRKIISIILAVIAIAGCTKEIPVRLDHPVEVELPLDVQYTADTVLYLNVSEETAVDFTRLSQYVGEVNPDVFLALAKDTDRDALTAAVKGCGLDNFVVSDARGAKVSVIASREKMKVQDKGSAWTAASFGSYSLVVGLDNEDLMEDTSQFDGRIFCLASSSDPSEKFYRKTFCNCIAAQWGEMVPTSVTSENDYVFARPAQWTDSGTISMDRNAFWKHFPLCFTIKKEL